MKRTMSIALFFVLILSSVSFAGQLGLAWDPNPVVEEVTSYKVYRCTGATCTPTVSIATVAASTTPGYTDTGVTSGVDYTYAVTAVNITGESAKSATVTGRFLPGIPTPPGNVRKIP